MRSRAKPQLLALGLLAGSLLATTATSAVEIFTSPEKKLEWERRQAAEKLARMNAEKADALRAKAAQKATQATTAVTKATPAKPAATTAAAAPAKDNLAVTKPAANQKALMTPAAEGSSAAATADASPRKGGPPCLTWINPDVEPKAALLCVHGLGLHSGSYTEFGKALCTQGVAVYAVDVRGFGSFQKKGEGESIDFAQCLEDVHHTLKLIHRVHRGLPVFLLGESMGGAIALRATAMYPDLVDGLVSCVPAGDRLNQGKTSLKVALHYLRGANKQFDIGSQIIDQASASNDKNGSVNEDLKKDWMQDELSRLKLSPNELISFQKFMNENHENAKLIAKCPVIMVQGGDDNLVKAAGTLQLLSNIPVDNKDVRLVVIRHAKHLIFEEFQFNDEGLKDEALKLVTRFMADHPKRATAVTTQATPH